VTTYKIGEFSNSTADDERMYFSGLAQDIGELAPQSDVQPGTYRVDGHRLVRMESEDVLVARDPATN